MSGVAAGGAVRPAPEAKPDPAPKPAQLSEPAATPPKLGWASRGLIGILRMLQSKPIEVILFVPTYLYVMATY